MEKIAIELPSEIDFKRAGHTFRVAFGNLNADIIAQLVMHGVAQKIGDSAAGKSGDDALKAMQATYDALVAGNWGRTRAGGGGVSEFQKIARTITRERLKAKISAEQYKAAITDADAADRDKLLDELFAKNEATLRPLVEKEVKRREAERKAKAEVSIDIGGMDI